MRTIVTLLPLLTFLSGSCGQARGDSPPGLQEQSGSRLKRRFLVASDGAVMAMWFYDTKLGQDCAWLPADGTTTTGSWLCLPLQPTFPIANPGQYVSAHLQTTP